MKPLKFVPKRFMSDPVVPHYLGGNGWLLIAPNCRDCHWRLVNPVGTHSYELEATGNEDIFEYFGVVDF